MLNQKDIKQIRKIPGEVRGVVFKTDLKFVKKLKGEKGVRKIKDEIRKIEPDFNFEQIKNLGWYPLRWRALSLFVIKKSFAWSQEDIYEIGRAAPSNSFIAKILLRYFYNFKKTCEEAAHYWGKHYSEGVLELKEFNNQKKRVVYCLKDFKIHPILCPYLTGYFQGIAELTAQSPNIKTQETKCSFNKGLSHEFVIKW